MSWHLRAPERRGRTVVLITHEDDVARRARRIIRLADGRIVSDDRIGAEEAA